MANRFVYVIASYTDVKKASLKDMSDVEFAEKLVAALRVQVRPTIGNWLYVFL